MELNRTQSKYSNDAFQRTCVQREFNSMTKRVYDKLNFHVKVYMKLLDIDSKDFQKIFQLIIWSWKSVTLPLAGKGFNFTEYMKRGIYNHLEYNERLFKPLEILKYKMTNEEKDKYEIIRANIVKEYLSTIKIEGYKLYTNPIRIISRMFYKWIGTPRLNETYFQTPIYEIFDNWIDNLFKYKKQCEKGLSKGAILKRLVDYDDNTMKRNPYYPFGKESHFNREKDLNSPEFKSLMALRDSFFKRVNSETLKKARFCNCLAFKPFYATKYRELEYSGQSTVELMNENNQKWKAIMDTCTPLCKERKRIFDESVLKRKQFNQTPNNETPNPK